MYKVVGDDKKNDNCPALHISYYRRGKIDVFRNVMKTPIKQFKLLITNKCQTKNKTYANFITFMPPDLA